MCLGLNFLSDYTLKNDNFDELSHLAIFFSPTKRRTRWNVELRAVGVCQERPWWAHCQSDSFLAHALSTAISFSLKIIIQGLLSLGWCVVNEYILR